VLLQSTLTRWRLSATTLAAPTCLRSWYLSLVSVYARNAEDRLVVVQYNAQLLAVHDLLDASVAPTQASDAQPYVWCLSLHAPSLIQLWFP
jgi:hypothetical protein